jgi:hypothetical protein
MYNTNRCGFWHCSKTVLRLSGPSPVHFATEVHIVVGRVATSPDCWHRRVSVATLGMRSTFELRLNEVAALQSVVLSLCSNADVSMILWFVCKYMYVYIYVCISKIVHLRCCEGELLMVAE